MSLKVAIVGLLLAAGSADAKWARVGEDVPVDRVIANVTRYVKDHAEDGQGYYVLARIHSLAYATAQDKVHVIVDKDLPAFPPYESIRVSGEALKKLDGPARQHLVDSLTNYATATKLAPEKPLYWMGRGWMAAQAAQHAGDPGFAVNPDQIGTTLPAHDASATLPDAVRLGRQWEDLALTCYQKVIDLAMADDLKNGHAGPAADSVLSDEAIRAALQILKARPGREPDPRIAELEKRLAQFKSMGRAVTPIIFSLKPSSSVQDLLAANLTTTFNLAGDDRRAVWPWLKPDTCILVWDPQHTGKITSGRQLFGSATFWMFFEDGYKALAALDDDGNGYLSGDELKGIAVWRDANGNGVCDPGEVVPIEQLGIAKIATHATWAADGTLQTTAGITLQNGRMLPTYDWTPRSLPMQARTAQP